MAAHLSSGNVELSGCRAVVLDEVDVLLGAPCPYTLIAHAYAWAYMQDERALVALMRRTISVGTGVGGVRVG